MEAGSDRCAAGWRLGSFSRQRRSSRGGRCLAFARVCVGPCPSVTPPLSAPLAPDCLGRLDWTQGEVRRMAVQGQRMLHFQHDAFVMCNSIVLPMLWQWLAGGWGLHCMVKCRGATLRLHKQTCICPPVPEPSSTACPSGKGQADRRVWLLALPKGGRLCDQPHVAMLVDMHSYCKSKVPRGKITCEKERSTMRHKVFHCINYMPRPSK